MRLTDLLALLLVSAVLADLIASKIIGTCNYTKGDAAKTQLASFAGMIDRFRLDCGRYPTTAEGLTALHSSPVGLKGWSEPYTERTNFNDPWGRPYRYLSDGRRFVLTSYGQDGKPGGEGYDGDIMERSTGNVLIPAPRDPRAAEGSSAGGRP